MCPYHLSAQSQNEFIELIGREVQQRIVQEIKDAGMYSVMADTTPDVSHKDRLAIACRYVDKIGQPRERLVSLTEAKDKTGEGGATEIIESLTEQGLDLDELCFQSYNYTASMSGRFNGVQKKLQDKLGKSVPYIPCLAHRSNTVIEHSCKASPIVTELFNVLEALFVFFYQYYETEYFFARVHTIHGSRQSIESTKSLKNSMDSSCRINKVCVEQLRSHFRQPFQSRKIGRR